jgi:excisionase family DNA binding protein
MWGVPNDKEIIAMVDQLLTGEQVAEILHISRSFAYSLMKRGELPTIRIGSSVRVRIDDLEAYIEGFPNEPVKHNRQQKRHTSRKDESMMLDNRSNTQK